MGIGTEFAPIPISIEITDGVTMAAHEPCLSSDHVNPCSKACSFATNSWEEWGYPQRNNLSQEPQISHSEGYN